MKTTIYFLVFIGMISSCKPEVHREYMMEPCPENEKVSAAQQIKELKNGGYETFDMVNPDTGFVRYG